MLVFVLTGGKNGPLGPITGTAPDVTVPDFSFDLGKALPIPTVEGANVKKLRAPASQAQQSANDVIDTFYTEAFLDPANWRDGSYDDAFQGFRSDAATQAKNDTAALTAGSVGDTFSKITPAHSTLKTNVLLDSKGQPVSMVAIVKFVAKGVALNGGTHTFVSLGQFFLLKVDGDWKIVSFDVRRKDADQAASATPSTSGSTTGSPS